MPHCPLLHSLATEVCMGAKRLTDEQMQSFIRSGYIEVVPDLPPEFHSEMFSKIEHLYETEGNPGNNILPRIPELHHLFEDQTVHGALCSLLGDDYYQDAHRFVHFNKPHSDGQTLHKDSFTRRRHHTRWLVTFYYPQDTPLEMGPTGVLPGSQYFNTIPEDSYAREYGLAGPAGRVAIANYDIVHRGLPNKTEKNRYMAKFLFNRMSEPTKPTWDYQNSDWPLSDDPRDLIWAYLWDWHKGAPQPNNSGSIGDLVRDMVSADETNALNAAYTLAGIGQPAVKPLIDVMLDGSAEEWILGRDTRRRPPGFTTPAANASYALAAIGSPAIPQLIQALDTATIPERDLTIQVLSDMGIQGEQAIPALAQSLADPAPAIRAQAAEGLGQIAQRATQPLPALTSALQDRDETVRRNAALSLGKLAANSADAVPDLERSIGDPNRYVVANTFEALDRIGTPEAHDTLIKHLKTARWCPITAPGSLY